MKNFIAFCTSSHSDKNYSKVDGVLSSLPFYNCLQFIEIPVDIHEYFKIYQNVASQPATCKIYGIPAQDLMNNARRTNKNLISYQSHEVVFDLDQVSSPTIDQAKQDHLTLEHIQKDVDNFIFSYLPGQFHQTSYILRLSSNFAIKDGLRVHLHFISQEPLFPEDLRNWVKTTRLPVDSSIYRLAQPIYTAAPVWKNISDPLLNFPELQPRVFLIQKYQSALPEKWFPLSATSSREHTADFISQIPTASDLPGKAGAFCRNVAIGTVLSQLGYVELESGRWLSPSSTTDNPGLMVFENGYCFSHHSDDPFALINQQLFNNIKATMNAYDLAKGYAQLNGQEGHLWFSQLLRSSLESDGVYTTNSQNEMLNRTQWLSPDLGYSGINANIVDSILEDLIHDYVSPLVRKEVFRDIAAKTKKQITLSDLESELKRRLKGDLPDEIHEMSKDADPSQQVDYYMDINILAPTGGSASQDFFTYWPESRTWKKRSPSATDDFVTKSLNNMLPKKVFFDAKELGELVMPIKKATVNRKETFNAGLNWAFKGGQYGLDVAGWQSPQWTPENAVFPLKKEDNVIRELPITYQDWLSKGSAEYYLKYLTSTFENDPDSLQLFLEISGYILDGSYCYPKFFVFEGNPGSGKSAATNMLSAMVGKDNVGVMDLKNFAYDFGTQHLMDKKLIIINEPRGIDTTKKALIMEKLLSITGGDTQAVNHKFGDIVQSKFPGKIVLATNDTPIFEDETGALRDRMVILRFNKRFRETTMEIKGIDRIIAERELKEIIRAAVNKLRQIRNNNGFTIGTNSQDALNNMDSLSSPLRTFINTNFDIVPNTTSTTYVTVAEFKELFRLHMENMGKEVDEKKLIGMTHVKSLRAINPVIDKKTVRYGDKTALAIVPLVFKDREGLILSLQQ